MLKRPTAVDEPVVLPSIRVKLGARVGGRRRLKSRRRTLEQTGRVRQLVGHDEETIIHREIIEISLQATCIYCRLQSLTLPAHLQRIDSH